MFIKHKGADYMSYKAIETIPGLNAASSSLETFTEFLTNFIKDNKIKKDQCFVEHYYEGVVERDVYDYTDEQLSEMYPDFYSGDNVTYTTVSLTLLDNNELKLSSDYSGAWGDESESEIIFKNFEEFYHFLIEQNAINSNNPSHDIYFDLLSF